MILVTGASGLTGQFVVAELLRRGHAVRELRRTPIASSRTEVVPGDLSDPDSLVRAARGVTGIVHTACTFSDSAIDIAAMAALLSAWTTGPFVFISSLDVYGLDHTSPITEATPCKSFNDYSDGKVVCERLLTERGGDYVSLRAPYIWGPHPTARKRLVGTRLEQHQPIILPGTTAAEWSQYRDAWIDVRDLATIVAECLARPAGGPLNVLTGQYSWHDLYVELIRLTGSRSEIIHRPLAEISDEDLPNKRVYAQTWQFSEARLAQHLGTIARRSFEATVRDTVRHRREAQS